MSLVQRVIGQRLASPLAVWGKLPEHGDYLRYRCNALQARDWQRWTLTHWDFTGSDTRRAEGAPVLGRVPVAFVLPPGTLGFAPKNFVQGVMVASHDRVGRISPLVFFQECSPAWMRRTWGTPHAQEARRAPVLAAKNQLFWLARLAACVHGAGLPWQDITRIADEIGRIHAPGWRQLFGARMPMPNESSLTRQLNPCYAKAASDVAEGLTGVQHLPWADWPQRLLRTANASPAYWQQDASGGYVNAGDSLANLWKALA